MSGEVQIAIGLLLVAAGCSAILWSALVKVPRHPGPLIDIPPPQYTTPLTREQEDALEALYEGRGTLHGERIN